MEFKKQVLIVNDILEALNLLELHCEQTEAGLGIFDHGNLDELLFTCDFPSLLDIFAEYIRIGIHSIDSFELCAGELLNG